MAAICCLMSGCMGSWPDVVSKDRAPGEEYSNAEVRQMIVDQPQTLSGDYFRKRGAENLSSEEKEPAAQGPAQSADQPHDAYGLKIGIIPEENPYDAMVAGQFATAALAAAGPDIILVGPDSIQEILANANCAGREDLFCIAGQLSIYPGVRMLIMCDAVHLPQSFPGVAALRCSVVDTGLIHSYPVQEMTLTVESRADADAFLQQSLQRLFSYAKEKAVIMPRHCRVFSVKDERCYIGAGAVTGLKTGDVFDVFAGGEMIASPTGIPVGWIPRDKRGTIRVESLLGEDSAACEPVDGTMPAVGDFVILTTGQ